MPLSKHVDTSQVTANLARIAAGLQSEALVGKWLSLVAAKIVAEAKRRVPVGETGNLMRSIGMRVEGRTAVIFATMEYAAVQHENLQYHHDRGEAKYIEKPLMEIGLSDLPETLREHLLADLGKYLL
jgi:hypothetical protein